MREPHVIAQFAVSLVLAGLGSLAALGAQTFTFKKVDALEIKADVYRTSGYTGPRPVLVWIHGGALMSGSRQSAADQPVKEELLRRGVTVVSIDYRLAPETKLPSIIADVEDAFKWVRERGPELFGADPSRIAAAGSSAGGYLTLTVGYRVWPRLRALVSFWGYGDLIGDWYSQPSKMARHWAVVPSKEEAYRLVAGPPVANAADRPGQGGSTFYNYCRQHGLWPKEVSGWDPMREPERFHAYMPLKNVTSDYPPTLLVHGMKDTDVPVENSLQMAAELKRQGVEHRLITDPEADHGSNWSPEAKATIDRAAVEFIMERLR